MAPLTAALVAVFCPLRAAVGTHGVPLRRLWWAHLFGVVLGAVAIALVIAATEADALTLPDVLAGLTFIAEDIVGEFRHYPGECFLATLAIVAAIQLVFAIAAFVFMSAGARDEPLRATYVHSIRQVWLSTSRIAVVILFTGAIGTTLDRMNQDWEQIEPFPAYPGSPAAPRASDYADQPAYDKALADYNTQMQQYNAATAAYWPNYYAWKQTKPWYLRDFQVFIVLAAFVGALWYVWLLLRGMTAPRPVVPIVRPPLCERCGYNLTAAAFESRCSECGVPVAESLGSDVRPGPPWERRGDIGWVRAYTRTAWCAMKRPSEFGRSLRVGFAGRDHRRFAAIHYPVFFLVGTGAMVVGALTQVDADERAREWHVFCAVALIFGVACMLGGILFGQFGALLVGFSQSVGTRRNLLPIAHQVSCYLSSFLVCWEVFGAFMAFFVVKLGSTGCFSWLASTTGIADDLWAFVTWAIPNALWGIAFLVFVSQATVAARFANK